MLKLHKAYSIPFLARVIKKLIQQYVSPFQIKDKIGCLAYRPEISDNWRIHPVFLVVQLETALKPSIDSFQRPYLHHPPAVFVDGDTDSSHNIPSPCLSAVILIVLNLLKSTAYLTNGWSKEVRAWLLSILFTEPTTALNGTGGIT